MLAEADQALVLTRVFDAPAALLFRVWTDPSHMMRWWGPRAHPAREMKMDLRVGGAWRGCLVAVEDGKELWQGGVFREIDPPNLLSFTFAWEEDGERGLETLVTLTFEEEGDRTRMTLRQTPFRSLGERDGHGGGWSSTFDRLEEFLASELKS